MMIRLSIPVCVMLTGLTLSGCSNGYFVDLTEVRQQQLARAEARDESAQRTATAARSTPLPPHTMTARARVTMDDAGPTGMISRPEIRPWPKTGTPEWNQLQADEIAREKRVGEVMRSICQGC